MTGSEREREFVVHWEATVYGTYGVYATSEEEAVKEAERNVIPSRQADDHIGPIAMQEVEDYSRYPDTDSDRE